MSLKEFYFSISPYCYTNITFFLILHSKKYYFMTNLQALQSSVLIFYKDGKSGLADGHLNGGEIIKLVMDGVAAAQIDWKALPEEWNTATLDSQFALLKQAQTDLGDDHNKDFIVGVLQMIYAAAGFKK